MQPAKKAKSAVKTQNFLIHSLLVFHRQQPTTGANGGYYYNNGSSGKCHHVFYGICRKSYPKKSIKQNYK
jgi:hypothetical protein